jgi:hypothetical protein
MVLKRSWPAVSQICNLTRLPSSSIVLILKSMPMVVMKEGVKESSLKRSKQHDFPTPESPISRSLICSGLLASCVYSLFRRRDRICGPPWRSRCGRRGGTYKEVVVSCPSHVCGVVCRGFLCVCVRYRGRVVVAVVHPLASEGGLYWWHWEMRERRWIERARCRWR